MAATPYADSRAYFVDEIECTKLRFQLYAEQKKSSPNSNTIKNLQKKIDQQVALIDSKLVATRKIGRVLPIDQVRIAFGLGVPDIFCLVLGVLAVTQADIRKLVVDAYANVQRDLPCLQLVSDLLGLDAAAQLHLRESLTDTHIPGLARWQLTLFLDQAEARRNLSNALFVVDERLLRFLLQSDLLDFEIADFAEVLKPAPVRGFGLADIPLETQLANLVHCIAETREERVPIQVFLGGQDAAARRRLATEVCAQSHIALLEFRCGTAAARLGQANFPALAQRLMREAVLFQAAVFVDKSGHSEIDWAYKLLVDAAAQGGAVLFWGENDLQGITEFSANSFAIALPEFGFLQRKAVWLAALKGENLPQLDVFCTQLASKYFFSEDVIRHAVEVARNHAILRSGDTKLTADDIIFACRAQYNGKLSQLAVRIVNNFRFEDIILPTDQLAQLREIVDHQKFKGQVYDTWDFNRTVAYGRGLTVLFSGQSGTGKTMAASIVANELQLEIYKIDLSTVISKYIGDTEKNLARIFAEASSANAVLFFDEAESLFGKRTEIKDAHDRYANVEVGFLLQKIEEYEGIAVLATNLRENMDEAFIRRMRFIVEFPFPDAADRKKIWRASFPAASPLEATVDFDFLAEKFVLAGGNIKNIALAAAFYAAATSQKISMHEIMSAGKREYQKLGRVFLKDDFGAYFSQAIR